jgi:uncharacterized protein
MNKLHVGMFVYLAPLLAGPAFAAGDGGMPNDLTPWSQASATSVAIAPQAVSSAGGGHLLSDLLQLRTVVFEAVRTGDARGMPELLRQGIDVNMHDETGQTPLIAAALSGQVEIARILIDDKADVRARTQNGMTALHAAAYAGSVEIAQMLIAGGADVNDQANVAGITPLHAAAEEDRLAVATKLLEAGADVSRLEVNGYSAGSRAGWREHWDVVRILLRSGDKCQSEDVAGAWLFEKCTHLDLNASN